MESREFPFDRRVTRRQFLTGAGAVLTGLAFPHDADARRTRGTRPPKVIVGSGRYRYECIHDWLWPPDRIKWGYTHGVAEDSAGNLYVAHTVHPDSPSGDGIVVFDKHGKFLRSWGEQFRGGAHGLDVRVEDGVEYLYHCDIAHRRVAKTTLDGHVVWDMGLPHEAGVYKGDDPFVPTNVAFSPNGDFYVADGYGSNWIHQYDIKANYVRTFGGTGTEPGKFRTPHGIWLDTRAGEPVLVIADRSNARLQYFTLDGKYLRTVTDGMRQPCEFNTRGDLAVIPDLKSVVTILDRENRVVAQLGDGDPSNLDAHPRSDFLPGKFIHPHDAEFLHNGNILVAEWVPIGRVTLLRKAA